MDCQTAKGRRSGIGGNSALVPLLLVLVIPVYAWRLTWGVGLSDEGYYALYPVAWLRSSPSDTGILHLHQFAGTITFPLVKIYSLIRPDLTGLILALRIVFGCAALGVTVLIYRLMVMVLPAFEAASCSGAILLFIPFGIPTLSYNTLGMLGTIGGVAIIATRILEVAQLASPHATSLTKKDWTAALGCAMLFVIAALAYPTLVVLPFLLFLLLAIHFPSQKRLVRLATAMFVAGGIFGLASSMVFLGGPARIRQIIDFSLRMDNSLGIKNKIWLAVQMLFNNPYYLAICIMGVAAGILRQTLQFPVVRMLHFILIAALGVKIAMFINAPPVLCTRGHDLIFYLAMAGSPTLFKSRGTWDTSLKLLSILYIVGICGGLLNAYTATLSMFNFCLVGVLAAVAGMGSWIYQQPFQRGRMDTLTGPVWCITLVSLIGWTSTKFVYGETGGSPVTLQCYIERGPYAGLWTGSDTAELIRQFNRIIKPYKGVYRTIDVCGPLPGFYLLTSFKFRSPMPYILEDHRSKNTYEMLTNHYMKLENRPELFVWVQNYQLKLNQVQERLLQTDYQEIKRDATLVVYLRRSASSVSKMALQAESADCLLVNGHAPP